MAFLEQGGLPRMPMDRMQAQRAEALADVIGSDGWQHACIPALRVMKAGLERELATGSALTLDAVRHLQGEWSVIERILRDARSFFDVRGDG